MGGAPESAPFDAPAPFNQHPDPYAQTAEPSPFDENAQTIANMPGGEPYRPPGGAFAPGRRTGPAEDHRDGGGPDTSLDTPDDLDEDDLDIPV